MSSLPLYLGSSVCPAKRIVEILSLKIFVVFVELNHIQIFRPLMAVVICFLVNYAEVVNLKKSNYSNVVVVLNYFYSKVVNCVV